MKNTMLSLLLLTATVSHSQTAQEFFGKSDREVYWMGIDFTHVQLVGEFAHFFGAGEKGPEELASHYFPAWNELIVYEPKKYDVQKMVSKPRMKYDLDCIQEKNSMVDPNSLKVMAPNPYTEADIKKFVAEYTCEKKPAFGVLFLAESLDKVRKQGYFHLVVINMETNEVLFTQRLKGEPFGIGVRNYWAGSIHDVIEKATSNYRGWKAKHKK